MAITGLTNVSRYISELLNSSITADSGCMAALKAWLQAVKVPVSIPLLGMVFMMKYVVIASVISIRK